MNLHEPDPYNHDKFSYTEKYLQAGAYYSFYILLLCIYTTKIK